MNLLSFEYSNEFTSIDKIIFNQMNLLVGASGSGKTTILKALQDVIDIGLGDYETRLSNNFSWTLEFEDGNQSYRWEGKVKTPEQRIIFDDLNNEEIVKIAFISESMVKDFEYSPKIIFKRENNSLSYLGKELPNLAINQTCLEILSEEDEIIPIVKAFRKVYNFNFDSEAKSNIGKIIDFEALKKETVSDLASLRELNVGVMLKLAICYEYHKGTFSEIVEIYKSIFHFIEDVRFERRILPLEDEARVIMNLQIKELGSEWISKKHISSGMLKTFLYISTLYLMPRDSIILIDEFENSLGVNCLNIINDDMDILGTLQQVITSHHPYIINNVQIENWKIVSRSKDHIYVNDASNYNIGKSKHEAFYQLINLPIYKEGRA